MNLKVRRSASMTPQMSFSVSVAGAGIDATLWKNLICQQHGLESKCVKEEVLGTLKVTSPRLGHKSLKIYIELIEYTFV